MTLHVQVACRASAGGDDAPAVAAAIAHGWLRGLSAATVRLSTAGWSLGDVPAEVQQVLAEVGIGAIHRASEADAPPAGPPDLVVQLGPVAPSSAEEARPTAPVRLARRVTWAVPSVGAPDRRLDGLRAVRSAVGDQVAALLAAEGRVVSFGAAVRDRFALAPDITFLNHGSYGATPRVVLEAQHAYQRELEAQPVRFMNDLPARLEAVLAEVGAFLGADRGGLAFVDNATTGVATVLGSYDWRPGDVVVTTGHRYEAVARALERLAERYGVRVHTIPVPFPLADAAEVVQAVRDGWPAGPVKLAVIDQIPSVSGLVWPIRDLIAIAREHGAPVLVDGAHVPGHVPVDVGALGADFWVGNLHKWLFAPKGCAVLHLAEPHRSRVRPLVTSLGHGRGMFAEFHWVGTRDPSAWLAARDALAFVRALGGIDRIRCHNVALRARGADILERDLGMARAAPPDLLAALESRVLPGSFGLEGDAWSARLWTEHRVEAMIAPLMSRLWLRLSAQIYNTPADYQRLAEVLAPQMG